MLSALEDFKKTQVIKKVTAGFDRHCAFLTKDGHVYTRGANWCGQLGLGDFISRYRKDGVFMPIRIRDLENIIDIEVASHRTFCLNQIGQVYAFGLNSNGELGVGDTVNRNAPQLIIALQHTIIISIQAYSDVTYFLDMNGQVYVCGGADSNIALGLGKHQAYELNLPKQIANLPAIKTIIPGGRCVFFLSESGEVYSCGANYVGQLGLEDNKTRFRPTKVNLDPIRQVGAYWNSTFFLTNKKEVFVCGKLGHAESLTGVSDCKPYSLVKLAIAPIVKLRIEREIIFITEEQRALVYLHEDFPQKIGETIDFLEHQLTIPPEIEQTRNYNWFNAPLYACEKKSLLEEQCHARAYFVDNDWAPRNKLLIQHSKNEELVSLIKWVSEKEKNTGQIPTLKLLSALSFIKNHKKPVEFPQAPHEVVEYTTVIDSIQKLDRFSML